MKQSQSDTRVEKSQAVGIICLLEKKEPVHLRRLFFERGGEIINDIICKLCGLEGGIITACQLTAAFKMPLDF